jgi:hypothetical protein
MTREALVEDIYDGIVEMPGWSTFLGHCTRVFGVTAASILIETHSLGHPERLRLFSSGVGAETGSTPSPRPRFSPARMMSRSPISSCRFRTAHLPGLSVSPPKSRRASPSRSGFGAGRRSPSTIGTYAGPWRRI